MLIVHQRVRQILPPLEFTFDIDTAQGDATPTFAIPLVVASTSSNFDVDWGDGTTETITGFGDANLDHTYASGGTYTVRVTTNDLNGWAFANAGDKDKITNISDWGGFSARNAAAHFHGCSNLNVTAATKNITAGATSLQSMFFDCTSLTTLDVSGFDTSSAINMSNLFYNCTSLTALDVSNFDTTSVTNMGAMFRSCNSLTTLDVSNFDTSNVTTMGAMFFVCNNITTLDLSNFDTASVTNMSNMFRDCSSLTTLDVSNFDTSNVTDMINMFRGCNNLTTLDVAGFDISSLTTAFDMFFGTTLDTPTYNALLISWESQVENTGVPFHGGNAQHSGAGTTARGVLTGTSGWTITDGGAV